MKRFVIITMVLAFAAAVTLIALGDPLMAGEKANPKKGKFLFKNRCKECHWPDKAGGDVTPIFYTQKQWESFFSKGKYLRKMDNLDKEFTAEDLGHIQQYLIEHAADSDQPETCG